MQKNKEIFPFLFRNDKMEAKTPFSRAKFSYFHPFPGYTERKKRRVRSLSAGNTTGKMRERTHLGFRNVCPCGHGKREISEPFRQRG